MSVFDDRLCILGEGPLWHPLRKQLFWFDIVGKAFMTRFGEDVQKWDFDEYVSACAWIDESRFLIASASALFTFDIETAERSDICPLEADKPLNRSNDGRADPFGGFWIGTMGIKAEPKAGAIYRYYKGELVTLFDNITISNAICFTPDGKRAYFTDTRARQVMTVDLDQDGWPTGDPKVFLDFIDSELNPDGAVVDSFGNLWVAQWGAHRVAAYAPDGDFLTAENFPASRISCPAFGGENYATLFATSARQGASENEMSREPWAGAVFCRDIEFVGQAEHKVSL